MISWSKWLKKKPRIPSRGSSMGTTWQAAARQFGGEACANGRRRMNEDDREDVAFYHRAGIWTLMPEEDQNKAVELFNEGWLAERKNQEEI